MKEKAAGLFLFFSMLFSTKALSQEFNFNILPTAVNPAFTGLFDGRLRASALFKSQWLVDRPSFIAYGASVDGAFAPKRTGYFATGLAFLNGRAADGSFSSFSSFASVAYHKTLGGKKKEDIRWGDIGAGLQLGYIKREVDIADVSNSFLPSVFKIGSGAQYLVMNVGLSFSHMITQDLSYTVALAGNNLNLFDDGTVGIKHPLLRITPSYTGLLAANWEITDRLGVRPAFLHLISTSFYVYGNEFRYKTSKANPLNTVFVSGWYRSTRVVTFNAGYEFKQFRLGGGIDCYLEGFPDNGGLQIIARYIMPRKKTAQAEPPK